jgi:glycosyltransferase involved in cell wall biosynthesis
MYYTSGVAYNILHYFEKLTWSKVDGIIAISYVMREYIEKEMGWRPRHRLWESEKVHVVPDPVDPIDFPRTSAGHDRPTVMFHGLLTRNKNVDILLDAARRLPSVAFDILGDGPELERLEYEAPNNVHFYGWIPHHWIHEHLNRCNVGVALRSDNPGNQYVVTSPFLQYSVLGKPCLVTRRTVFGDYPWQFDTLDEFVEKLEYLLKHPEEGAKMREYILETHDARKISDKIWGLLVG